MYSRAQDIRLLMGDPPEREVPSRLITVAQRKAASIINDALKNIYTTPFESPYPEMVVSWEEDIAIYYISRTKFFAATTGISIDLVQEHFDKAMSGIKKAMKRELKLTGATPYQRIHSATLRDHRIFDTLDELEWGPDCDLQDRLRDERCNDCGGAGCSACGGSC